MTDCRNIIHLSDTLFAALEKLNALSGSIMTLFVVDADGVLAGTLTDGDVRRAFLGGALPESPVERAVHRDCAFVCGTPDPGQLRDLRARGIRLVPVVDQARRVVDAIDLSGRRTRLPLRALLMAGGKGERLRPATLTTPKPLLKIEGKAIIDYNIEALAACGIDDITVATRYLADQIDHHFATPVAGVQVKTVREEAPLGTIGAAAMLEPSELPTLVMNSDLLTTASFEEMYLHHRDSCADATVAAVPYQVSVPYAILTPDPEHPDRVAAVEEKPSFSYYANAGMYIFSPRVMAMVRPRTRLDATDLLSMAIAAGLKVAYYPVKGTWIDVGSPVDFRQAGELMRHVNALSDR